MNCVLCRVGLGLVRVRWVSWVSWVPMGQLGELRCGCRGTGWLRVKGMMQWSSSGRPSTRA